MIWVAVACAVVGAVLGAVVSYFVTKSRPVGLPGEAAALRKQLEAADKAWKEAEGTARQAVEELRAVAEWYEKEKESIDAKAKQRFEELVTAPGTLDAELDRRLGLGATEGDQKSKVEERGEG